MATLRGDRWSEPHGLRAIDGSASGRLVEATLPIPCQGVLAEHTENGLIFGLPGRGKTHLVVSLGLGRIQQGVAVLLIAVFKLVQRMLAAHRDQNLEREPQKLDVFDVPIIDYNG